MFLRFLAGVLMVIRAGSLMMGRRVHLEAFDAVRGAGRRVDGVPLGAPSHHQRLEPSSVFALLALRVVRGRGVLPRVGLAPALKDKVLARTESELGGIVASDAQAEAIVGQIGRRSRSIAPTVEAFALSSNGEDAREAKAREG